MATKNQVDVTVENGGSVFMFTPHTPAAQEWAKQHLPAEVQWLCNRFAVEPRYAKDIAQGMLNDGLTVE